MKYQLKCWNHQCFGNIFQAKEVAQAELDGITRQIREFGLFEALNKEEAKAMKNLEECELCDEI